MINLNTNFIFYLSLVAITTRSSYAAPVEENQDEGTERGTGGRCQDDLLFCEETQKCYSPQTKGPCPNDMKLLDTLENSSKGACGCPKQGQIDGHNPQFFPVFNVPVPATGYLAHGAAIECGPLKRMDKNGDCLDIVSYE